MSQDILQTPDLNFPEADLSPPAFRILLCTICYCVYVFSPL